MVMSLMTGVRYSSSQVEDRVLKEEDRVEIILDHPLPNGKFLFLTKW